MQISLSQDLLLRKVLYLCTEIYITSNIYYGQLKKSFCTKTSSDQGHQVTAQQSLYMGVRLEVTLLL